LNKHNAFSLLEVPKVRNAILQKENPMLSADIHGHYHEIQYMIGLNFAQNYQNQVGPISSLLIPKVSTHSTLIFPYTPQAFPSNVRSLRDNVPVQFCQVV